jgi:hypothetical protein
MDLERMAELTPAERAYLARAEIVVALESSRSPKDDRNPLGWYVGRDDRPDLPDEGLLSLGFPQVLVDAYHLAVEDREKAQRVMEEDSAYRYLMSEMSATNPHASKPALQRAVRSLVADEPTRQQAIENSGLYARLDEEGA